MSDTTPEQNAELDAEKLEKQKQAAHAQRSLLKILAIATLFPTLWVILLSSRMYANLDQATAGEEGFAIFVVVWGFLTPVIWLVSYGYTLIQINRGNMEVGRIWPLVPALWFIFWFATQLARQSQI